MATGQGTTWVVVADAHHARVLEVEDAGLVPRPRGTLRPEGAHGEHHGPERGWSRGADPHPLEDERRFAHQIVQALEHGLAENHFRHLVLVAAPRMLGILRESLSRGLADRLRASTHADWGHVPDRELAELVRPLVQIWPERG